MQFTSYPGEQDVVSGLAFSTSKGAFLQAGQLYDNTGGAPIYNLTVDFSQAVVPVRLCGYQVYEVPGTPGYTNGIWGIALTWCYQLPYLSPAYNYPTYGTNLLPNGQPIAAPGPVSNPEWGQCNN